MVIQIEEVKPLYTTLSIPSHVREQLRNTAERLGVSQQVVLQALIYLCNDPYTYSALSNLVKIYTRNGDHRGKDNSEVLPEVQGDQDA
jgi:hypothetical protein